MNNGSGLDNINRGIDAPDSAIQSGTAPSF